MTENTVVKGYGCSEPAQFVNDYVGIDNLRALAKKYGVNFDFICRALGHEPDEIQDSEMTPVEFFVALNEFQDTLSEDVPISVVYDESYDSLCFFFQPVLPWEDNAKYMPKTEAEADSMLNELYAVMFGDAYRPLIEEF